MIQVVMKPDYSVRPKDGENCYKCLFNGEDVGFRVWGKRASHAEDKLMVIFRKQLKEKVVDYDLEAYKSVRGDEADKCECGLEDGKSADANAPDLPGFEGS